MLSYFNARLIIIDSISPGKGVLVKCGEYWYPARLIEYNPSHREWTVVWWRGCHFLPGMTPDYEGAFREKSIRDELWHDKAGRRKVKVLTTSEILKLSYVPLSNSRSVRTVDTCMQCP